MTSRLEQICSLLLVAAATRYLLMFFHRGANLLDEGSTVAMADRILHGSVIYRDFLTVATPGSFYTVAWLFRVFGSELMVVRWTVFALNIVILVVALTVARRLMSWPFAAASALLTVVWGWFFVAPNLYSLQAMCFALLALACYLRGFGNGPPRRAWLFAAGLACGLAMMVKQNTGVYAAISLSLSLWLTRLCESPTQDPKLNWHRDQRGLVVGVALVVVPTLLYLIAIGAGPHLYENWIYYPLQRYPQGLAFEYPPFSSFSLSDSWEKFVLYLPWLVYPLSAVAIVMLALRKQPVHDLIAVTIFGAITFLQAFPRADLTHILFAIPPAFILLGYLCFSLWQLMVRAFMRRGSAHSPAGGATAIRVILAIVALLPLAALLREGDRLTMNSYATEYVPLATERARGVRTNMRNASQIDRVTSYLVAHTAPGDAIFVVPWAAGFYFLADRPNPTRFDVLLYGDPDEYPCLIAALDQSKPSFVVYGYGWDVDGKRFSDYALPVDHYIRTRYEVAERFDEYEIWRRLDAAEPVYQGSAGACRRRVLDGREFRRMWRQILGGGS